MSSASTRCFFGASVVDPGPTGGGLAMPAVDGTMSGRGDFVSDLSALKAKGARAMMKFVGAPSTHRDANSAFSLRMWKVAMDEAFARTSPQQMGNFFKDGTILCNYMVDDVKAGTNVFSGGAPTYADFEAMAQYSKSVWTMVPCMVRVENQYLKSVCLAAGASHYTHVDFGFQAWVNRFGPVQTLYTNHVNDGRAVKLGAMVGMQLLTGGSGKTAPWNVHPDGSLRFGMSPQEIDACGAAFSALTTLIGVSIYAQNPSFDEIDYWHLPSIQTALTAFANRASGRLQGPINWRDISGSTSGSTQTVGGSWALLGTSFVRANIPTVQNLVLPTTIPSKSVIGIVAYSRDSGRSSVCPSGWSEAKRISGNSAQGGDLALYYKQAVGNEGGTVQGVTWSGTAADTACQLVGFAFSGNTALTQAAILSRAGSARSWAGGTSNMGPVPGVQSTVSDALVLAIAARTNDFNNGDPVPSDTISATTSGGETWNRLILSTNVSGADSGILIDYAATSGLPSITTKSWTHGTGAGSNASGAGCGFMVAFAPGAIVAGTPPVLADLEDITFSISSSLSFTLTSTGSTPFTYSKTSGPSNITLDASTGAFEWTPLATGDYYIILKATNSHGSDEQDFRATVVGGSNVPPVITHPGDKTVVAQDRLSFVITAVDADGDPIRYELEDAPVGALLIEDSGQFSWTPLGIQGPGAYPIVVTVSDGQNESRSTFTVTVADTPWTRLGGPSTQLGRTNMAGNQFRRI